MLVKMELSNRRAKNVRTLFILSNNQVRNRLSFSRLMRLGSRDRGVRGFSDQLLRWIA